MLWSGPLISIIEGRFFTWGWGGGANYNHHLGLFDSDRPRLVVVIWAGALLLALPVAQTGAPRR